MSDQSGHSGSDWNPNLHFNTDAQRALTMITNYSILQHYHCRTYNQLEYNKGSEPFRNVYLHKLMFSNLRLHPGYAD